VVSYLAYPNLLGNKRLGCFFFCIQLYWLHILFIDILQNHLSTLKFGVHSYAFIMQIVVGRTGMETLTNEAGEVTRLHYYFLSALFSILNPCKLY
jgi:hypothetical protein